MELGLEKIMKYVTAGLAGAASVLFIVLGIIQKEVVLGLLWAVLVSAVIWLLLLIVKRMLIYFRDRDTPRRRLRKQAE